jgi:hypothetical protein
MNYIIKTLITRGSSHPLNCEDNFLVHEDDGYIICAVFDGCSSGIDSHIASYTHKKLLLGVIEESSEYVYNTDIEEFIQIHHTEFQMEMDEDISKKIIYNLYDRIYDTYYKLGEEMLSTVLLLVLNKETEEYEITFCGDGVSFVNGEYTNVHDPNGDTVWYLSTVCPYKCKPYGNRRNNSLPLNAPGNKIMSFPEYFEHYYNQCTKIKGQGVENICISTDGIDTFKNKYGQIVDAKDYFCNNPQFENLDNQLKRLYNIFTKGLNNEEKNPCMNTDDFTMIKIMKK